MNFDVLENNFNEDDNTIEVVIKLKFPVTFQIGSGETGELDHVVPDSKLVCQNRPQKD